MNDYIVISTLNDFIFCPYSIYLHNVYSDTDEDVYHAVPQTRGKAAHAASDEKRSSTRKDDLQSLSVISEKYRIYGKIDIYFGGRHMLVERKYQLKQIFRGQYYQLWAQYFCMKEMGFDVLKLAFYEISTNRMIPVPLPGDNDICDFESFLSRFRSYDPLAQIQINPNKCSHCVYSALCDKIFQDNVYQ